MHTPELPLTTYSAGIFNGGVKYGFETYLDASATRSTFEELEQLGLDGWSDDTMFEYELGFHRGRAIARSYRQRVQRLTRALRAGTAETIYDLEELDREQAAQYQARRDAIRGETRLAELRERGVIREWSA